MAPDLTLCLIVKDEQNNLLDCISSFKGLYSNLIITDTGSTDATVLLERNLGAEVNEYRWRDDFSAARNYCMAHVRTKWTMMVDADDRISANDRDNLIRILCDGRHDFDGIFLPYVYDSHGKTIPGSTSYLPRIWKTSLKIKYSLPVHEYLALTPATAARFTSLPFSIIHAKSPELLYPALLRDIRILEKAARKYPKNARLMFYLGNDLRQTGNFKDAISWFERFICTSKQKDELNRAYLGAGICHLRLGATAKAKDCFIKAINSNPVFIEPYLYLGDLAAKDGLFTESREWYAKAAECEKPRTNVFTDYSLYGAFAREKLNLALSLA